MNHIDLIDAETLVSYEVGTKYASEAAGIEFAFFYSDIDDMIIEIPTGRIIDGEVEVMKRNSNGGQLTGVEFSAHWVPVENWMLWANFTRLESSIETYPTSDPDPLKEPIDRQMSTTVNGGIKWSNVEKRLSVEVFGTWADDADELSTRDVNDTDRIPAGGTAGYKFLGVSGNWQALDWLRVTAAVENILDATTVSTVQD